MLTILGTLIIWLGLAMLLLGSLAFLVVAFRESVLWGLAVLFVSPCGLIFLILHWQQARNSFYLQLCSIAIILFGAFALQADLPWPLN